MKRNRFLLVCSGLAVTFLSCLAADKTFAQGQIYGSCGAMTVASFCNTTTCFGPGNGFCSTMSDDPGATFSYSNVTNMSYSPCQDAYVYTACNSNNRINPYVCTSKGYNGILESGTCDPFDLVCTSKQTAPACMTMAAQ